MNPITFKPLYMERVWGGREFERVYHRSLPDSVIPFGESWEIVDREGEQSVVDEGPFAGKTLHELWTFHREEIFGTGYGDHPRFPILIKPKIRSCNEDGKRKRVRWRVTGRFEWGRRAAMEEISPCSNSTAAQFDPTIVQVFGRLV